MSTVFFKVTPTQDKEIKTLMEKEGYTSKAEFFRFLVKFFKYTRKSSEVVDIEKSVKALSTVLKTLDKQGKLSTDVDEQLADV